MGWKMCDVFTCKKYRAARGGNAAADQADKCCFTGAVGADNSANFSGRQIKIDLIDSDEATKIATDAASG